MFYCKRIHSICFFCKVFFKINILFTLFLITILLIESLFICNILLSTRESSQFTGLNRYKTETEKRKNKTYKTKFTLRMILQSTQVFIPTQWCLPKTPFTFTKLILKLNKTVQCITSSLPSLAPTKKDNKICVI